MALEVLGRVRSRDSFANLVLPAAIRRAGLDRAGAALATEIAYGTLRRLGTLDWVISLHSTRPVAEIDGAVLDALRLGAYQILYMSVPAYAAVSETVEALREPRAQGFVNAILRKVAAGKDSIPWPSREGDLASYLEVVESHPSWVVRMWLSELGSRTTEALCAANNVRPDVAVRATRRHTTPEALVERFRAAGLDVRAGRWSPDVLRVSGGGAPASWPGFEEGAFTIQDEASVLVAEALAPGPRDVAVDLCAGPGGKAVQLASSAARTVGLDVVGSRAKLVREAARRVGVPPGRLVAVVGDGRRPPVAPGVDRVLVDAPCSGLGVIRRRPESRWRVRLDHVRALADLQRDLVVAGLGLLKPGGTLVYAVCTVTRVETHDVVTDVLARVPGAELEDVHPHVPRPSGRGEPTLQLLPHLHGTDGMFMARIRVGT